MVFILMLFLGALWLLHDIVDIVGMTMRTMKGSALQGSTAAT